MSLWMFMDEEDWNFGRIIQIFFWRWLLWWKKTLLLYCCKQVNVRFCASGSAVVNDSHVRTNWRDMYAHIQVGSFVTFFALYEEPVFEKLDRHLLCWKTFRDHCWQPCTTGTRDVRSRFFKISVRFFEITRIWFGMSLVWFSSKLQFGSDISYLLLM